MTQEILAGSATDKHHSPGKAEIVLTAWIAAALVLLLPVTTYLKGSFPLFTIIWLVTPLVYLWLHGDAAACGFRKIRWGLFLSTTAVNLGALLLIAILIEPWSHAYESLVVAALTPNQPDTTFAWLVRFQGWTAWAGVAAYSALVTLFGEELFFRGWLLQLLRRHLGDIAALLIQALIFTLPNGIAIVLLSPLQGVVYGVVYTFLGIGVVGGWAALRTGSIWPSLVSAVLFNLILTAVVL